MNGVDKITVQQTISRLKVSKADVKVSPFSSPEQRLMDLLDIKPETQTKLTQSRKANAYLQFWNAALRLFNGGKGLPASPVYTTEVETKKVDTKI